MYPTTTNPSDTIMDNNETEHYMRKAEALRVEHRDLDEVIAKLVDDPNVDEFQLKRLKRRKLFLKDQIAMLESKVIPDLNA